MACTSVYAEAYASHRSISKKSGVFQQNWHQTVCQPTGVAKAYNGSNFENLIAMAQPDTIDQIAERIDHLLLRHEELQRTHVLLTQQVQALTLERDQLKSRLSAARARVDSLIERLPQASVSATPEASQ
jgi:hypothetical protein